MSFAITRRRRWLAYWFNHHPRLLTGLAHAETALLPHIGEPDRPPVYVTGLARAGSTRMLQVLSRLPGRVSHRHCDQAGLFTPYLWQRVLDRSRVDATPIQRAHGDGIQASPVSPEAFEEVLWQAGWGGALGYTRLDADQANPRFDRLYGDHIRKLVAARGGRGYLAKNNALIPRLAYLHARWPEARFVVMVRRPAAQIASLMRQHDHFSRQQQAHPASRAYLAAIGHREFGQDRLMPDLGCGDAIDRAIAAGDEARAWAYAWAAVYAALVTTLDRHPSLADRVRVVWHHRWCQCPEKIIGAVGAHIGHPLGPAQRWALSDGIRHGCDPVTETDPAIEAITAPVERALSRLNTA